MTIINASIEFLTPVHIGSGETVGPIEYFIKDGKLHKLNMPRFISSLTSEQRKSFIDFLDRDDQVKLRTFPQNIAKKEDCDLIIPVSKAIENEYVEKVKQFNNRLEINLFPQDGVRKRPYLPGSSLKGAFRTTIVQMIVNKTSADLLKEFLQNEKSFEAEVVGYKKDIRRDVFKALKIPDIALDSKDTEILDCQMYNPRKPTQGSFDQRMQVTYSKISRNQSTNKYSFQFSLNEKLMNDRRANLPTKFTIQELGNSANEHYLRIFHWEKKKFYSNLQSPEFNPFQNLKLESNQFLIRLGRFGHVESKTIDKIRNPKIRNRQVDWGKTRTIGNDKYPLGWAIITIPNMTFIQPTIDPNWEPTGIGKKEEVSRSSSTKVNTVSSTQRTENKDKGNSNYQTEKKSNKDFIMNKEKNAKQNDLNKKDEKTKPSLVDLKKKFGGR
ncbi:MAG: type III-A CRISPR-associated RAMP protein Csm5 [Leptospiraceae bacterium]|nr:type III-A CRISPR-associated RAMP protein Csm5 [Leptospiraceae bacterium]